MDMDVRSDQKRFNLKSDVADDIDIAIASMYAAIETFTKETSSENYYYTMARLGDLFYMKMTDDPDDNLLRSIACKEVALNFYTKDKYPEEYAQFMTDINIAYMALSCVLSPKLTIKEVIKHVKNNNA